MAQRKRGRPTAYTPALAAQVLAQIATTNLGLERICKRHKSFPSPKTIYAWMLKDEDFRKAYTRAKEDQAQVVEDEMLAIADTTQVGEIVTVKPDGREVKRADMIEHRKLRIETRKWLLGKLKPKKYGDRTTVAGDPEQPLEHKLVASEELIQKILGSQMKPSGEPKE